MGAKGRRGSHFLGGRSEGTKAYGKGRLTPTGRQDPVLVLRLYVTPTQSPSPEPVPNHDAPSHPAPAHSIID